MIENSMEEKTKFPDSNRLSVVSATILLVYAVSPFMIMPESELTLRIFGIEFYFSLNFSTLLSILVAVMAAVGADWLLRQHPKYTQRDSLQHWIIPGFTAWAIGIPLRNLELSLEWWAVFGFGGLLLILVFIAEYLVVDVTDAGNTLATIGLTAASFALFLILAISVRNAGLRLYLILPALVVSMALVSLRTLYLRLGGRWCFSWSFVVAVVIGHFVVGFHYWPLEPLSYGLFVCGPAYGLTSLAGALEERQPLRTIWIEPLVMMVLFWLIALLFIG